MQIIDDGNFYGYANTGREFGYMPRQTQIGKLEGVPLFAEAIPLIPESEWIPRIQAMNAAKAFPRFIYEDKKPVHQYQDGHPLCWAYSLTQAVEMSDENYVQLRRSIVGVAGWRDTGFYCDRAIQWAMEHGIAERSFVPQYSLRPANYKTGWQQNALRHRPIEWFDLGGKNMWAEVITALLAGFAVYTGYNRFGHAITLDSLVVNGTKIGVSSPNTWNEGTDRWTLFGTVAVPNEAFAVRTLAYE